MWPATRFPNGLRPHGSQEPSANKVQVGQRTGDKEPVGILLKASITDLGEMEDALNDAEDMFDAAADLGLHAILGALRLIHDPLIPIAAVREGPRLGGVLPKDIGLALIRRVTPHPGLVAMEEIG